MRSSIPILDGPYRAPTNRTRPTGMSHHRQLRPTTPTSRTPWPTCTPNAANYVPRLPKSPGAVGVHLANYLAQSQLVIAAPGPPIVTAAVVMATPVPAVLLAWGRTSTGQWAAGIAFLFHRWSRRALVTVWVPATMVRPHPGLHYRHVPRVQLVGTADDWPRLPPFYPKA
jgi:hypothetical protein